MSGVKSKSLQFVQTKDVFFHWVSCTSAMSHTIAAVHAYIEKTSKGFLNRWPQDERNGLQHFVDDNIERPGKPLNVRKCNCDVCKNIHDRLNVMRRDETQPIVLFELDKKCDWWTVLLFYLPAGLKKDKSFECFDKEALRWILKRCLLFDTFPMNQFKEVMDIRNQLMHSATYVVASNDKERYFSEMIALLHKLDSEETLEEVRKTRLRCAYSFEYPHNDELETAIKLQMEVIQRDMEHINSLPEPLRKQIFGDLSQIMSVARKNRQLLQNLKVVEKEQSVTLQQLIEMGAEAGAKELGADNMISAAIGRFGGAVGARAGGLYRMFFDRKAAW